MTHVKDRDEMWAIALLQQIIDRSNQDKDALPGSAVRKVKEAKAIMKKRIEGKDKR